MKVDQYYVPRILLLFSFWEESGLCLSLVQVLFIFSMSFICWTWSWYKASLHLMKITTSILFLKMWIILNLMIFSLLVISRICRSFKFDELLVYNRIVTYVQDCWINNEIYQQLKWNSRSETIYDLFYFQQSDNKLVLVVFFSVLFWIQNISLCLGLVLLKITLFTMNSLVLFE